MGEMAYVGSPLRGSSSYPYGRSSNLDDLTMPQYSNPHVRGIEEDLALIRQGEQAQQQQLSDEGRAQNESLVMAFLIHHAFQILKMPVKLINRKRKMSTQKCVNSKLL